LYATSGICAALYQREKTGQGTKIEVSLLETQLSVLSHIAANYLNTGIEARRHGTAHESIVPYQAFECKNGDFLVIASANDKFFIELCTIMNLPNFITDERYKTNQLRVKNRETLVEALTQKFKEQTLSEWINVFKSAHVPHAPVNNLKHVFENEQVKACDQILEIKSTQIDGKTIYVVGSAITFENVRKAEMCRMSPPSLGEHTKFILENELNYSDSKIRELFEQKIIQ